MSEILDKAVAAITDKMAGAVLTQALSLKSKMRAQ